MEVIIFQNELYTLYPIKYDFDFTILNCFEYCDAFREAFAKFDDNLNRWITKDGGVWFGCICR